MNKKIIFTLLIFIFTFSGCSINKKAEIPVKEVTINNEIEIKTKEIKYQGKLKHNDKGLPVLMYHSIQDSKTNEAMISPILFEEEMKYLKDNNYTTLSLDEAYNFFENNVPVPEKSVVLTFDDGYVDNYTLAYPILKKFGLKATIFVITSSIDTDPNSLTSSQLKELEDNGIAIESHTVHHEKLSEITYEAQLKTLEESKKFIEDKLNKTVNYIAYPYGLNNKVTVKATDAAKYKIAFTTAGKWSSKTNGILTLDRVFISGKYPLKIFEERITNPNYKTY